MNRRIFWLLGLALTFVAIVIAESSAPAPSGLTAGFHRGSNHAHIHRRGHGYGSDVSAASLLRLRDLGIDSVALTVFGYQRSADSPELFAPSHDPSLTAEDLIGEIRAAKKLGLRVVLKPHVWSRDFWQSEEWHGTIRQSTPAEHERWWNSYRSLVLEQARIALDEKVDALCLGTELVHMTEARHATEWRELIQEIRNMTAARPDAELALSYAAHWQHEIDQVPFWDALDAIGIAAYFPLDAPENASVDQLVRAWAPHVSRLAALHATHDRPIWFLEAGYRNVRGVHREPWSAHGGTRDTQAQARAFEAMFRALTDEPWWKGIYLWKSFTDPVQASEREDGTGFRFTEAPTRSVLRAHFKGVDSPP